jgi:predicted nucleic acid-binding protein
MGSNCVTIFDTGPIIHLDQIDSLQLLSICDDLVLPETVHEELSFGEIPEELEQLDYNISQSSGDKTYNGLDSGETAALQIAEERDNVVFLTDGLDARKKAKQLDIPVHGSIGVIALNYGRGRLDFEEAASLMRELQNRSQLFVTDAVIERGTQKLKEIQQSE